MSLQTYKAVFKSEHLIIEMLQDPAIVYRSVNPVNVLTVRATKTLSV